MKPLKSVNNQNRGQDVPWMAIIRMSGVGVDGDTVTIKGRVYHLNNGTAAGAGQEEVDITGSQTAIATCTALAAAVNGNFGSDKIRAESLGAQVALLSYSHFSNSETLTNGTVDAGGYGGTTSDNLRSVAIVERVATASEATDAIMRIFFGGDVDAVIVDVRTTTGAKKAWDGAISVTGQLVQLVNGAAVDWIAGDKITIMASLTKQ